MTFDLSWEDVRRVGHGAAWADLARAWFRARALRHVAAGRPRSPERRTHDRALRIAIAVIGPERFDRRSLIDAFAEIVSESDVDPMDAVRIVRELSTLGRLAVEEGGDAVREEMDGMGIES